MQKITPSVLRALGWSLLLALMFLGKSQYSEAQVAEESDATSVETEFISGVRQITFEGKRAGEGYFNSDASLMVFQSERRADNPFYQMYLLDFTTRLDPPRQ